jgi:hypothetical protein
MAVAPGRRGGQNAGMSEREDYGDADSVQLILTRAESVLLTLLLAALAVGFGGPFLLWAVFGGLGPDD